MALIITWLDLLPADRKRPKINMAKKRKTSKKNNNNKPTNNNKKRKQ